MKLKKILSVFLTLIMVIVCCGVRFWRQLTLLGVVVQLHLHQVQQLYNSAYIEGIANLYEFDCGSQSGWMYKVNGWFPNYGCSKYAVNEGDTIVWCYTCKGLGADVGGRMNY